MDRVGAEGIVARGIVAGDMDRVGADDIVAGDMDLVGVIEAG
jgi:hypothetical protein